MLGMGGHGIPDNIVVTTTTTGNLTLTSSTIPTNGLYLPAANTVGIAVNSALAASVSATAFTLATGLAFNTGATGQIVFPATQNPSSNANTLDDYEEGTWTPGISFGGGVTGITFTSVTGNYVKVGKILFLNFRIAMSNKGSSTGTARITGAPFTFNSTNTVAALAGVSFSSVEDLTFTANLTGAPEGGATTIQVLRNASGGASVALTDAEFANTTVLRGSVVTITEN